MKKEKLIRNRVECLSILSNNIKLKGYQKAIFDGLHKNIIDDDKYKFGRGTRENLMFYSEKYLWQSYYEFVGYLVLTKKIKSKNDLRYRCEDLFFDPTFPKLPRRFQIITNCLFPREEEDVQKWINSNKKKYLDDYFL